MSIAISFVCLTTFSISQFAANGIRCKERETDLDDSRWVRFNADDETTYQLPTAENKFGITHPTHETGTENKETQSKSPPDGRMRRLRALLL